jgi:hypothetical protein
VSRLASVAVSCSVAVVLLAAVAGDDAAGPAASAPEGSGASPSPSPTPSPAERSSRRGTSTVFTTANTFELAPEDTPYPYTTPIPPRTRTPLDGTYLRILTIEDVDGLLPFRCLRCPPFFLNAGVSTIAFHRGNYWLNHQLSGFKSLGMYTVERDRVTFFNDPWCPQDRGTYRWQVRAGALTFEPVSGTCVYEQARAKDLTESPWTKIKPCIYLIEHLWPGPIAC